MAIIRRGNSFGVRVWDPLTKTHDWKGSFNARDYGSQKEAEIAARQCELEEQQAVVRFGRETCGEFAERYLKDYNVETKDGSPRWAKKTVADMRTALKPFIARFGSVPLRRFPTPEARPWAQTQPRKYVATVRTMFADAVRDGLAPSNPFANLRLPQGRGRRDLVVLTEAELEEAIQTAERIHARFGSTFAAMVAMAGYVGLRPGEMFALEPSDVDLANLEVNIRQSFNGTELKLPKNGKPRRVILPPPAAERIQKMPRKIKAEWLFEPPTANSHFKKATLGHYWNPLRAAIGRPDYAFYALRHTAATLLLERGVTPEDVAHQLGHVDGGRLVRERYGHPNEDLIRERLKRAFDKPMPVIPFKQESEAAEQ